MPISINASTESFWKLMRILDQRIRNSDKRYLPLLTLLVGILTGIVFCRIISPEPLVKEVPVEVERIVYKDPEPVYKDEATQIARILYGLKDYNLSDNAKTAVVEVILNRASYGTEFPTTIMGVIEQPNQWQGYVSDGQYLQEDYNLAFNRLNSTDRSRVIPEGCYFMTVSNGKVVVRTKWDGGNTWSVT